MGIWAIASKYLVGWATTHCYPHSECWFVPNNSGMAPPCVVAQLRGPAAIL